MNTPVWQPKHPETTAMWQFMRYVEQTYSLSFPDYPSLHAWSVEKPVQFWQSLCEYFQLTFDTPPTQILNHYQTMLDARWFEGAHFNFAEKLLTRDDEHPALISINEQGERQVFSYQTLRQQVSFCAAGLKAAGIQRGDRIAAIMPNTAQTIIALLATASIGAIWSACSPDFGADAALDRLGQIEPKLLFICDGHTYQGKTHDGLAKIEYMSKAIPSLQHIIICPTLYKTIPLTLQTPMMLWDDFLKPVNTITFESLPFDHPLYILFSSGTTGKPKCIVHGAGGTLLQHIKELGLHTDIRANDNLCFYTTCGWMMWNWMISVLSLGATLTLYEGSPTYPNAMRLFELIEQENISVFGTSAKFISSVEKANIHPKQILSLPSLRCILSTGSPLLPQHYDFVYEKIKTDVQLSSISGGTDIVSCFALGNPITPVYRGELQCLGLGMSVAVFDENGQSVYETRGELVCTKPFPSMPIKFWHDPDKTMYQHAYFTRFKNIWTHGDFAEITAHQGLIIYGRSDATLNPGGVRIGTAEIYRQVDKMPDILESVVIGQEFQEDVRIILFVKLQPGIILDEVLKTAIRQKIRTHASPRHVPAKIIQVADIPRTINGKTVEITIRQVVNKQTVSNLQSLANPEALDYFRDCRELCE